MLYTQDMTENKTGCRGTNLHGPEEGSACQLLPAGAESWLPLWINVAGHLAGGHALTLLKITKEDTKTGSLPHVTASCNGNQTKCTTMEGKLLTFLMTERLERM